MNLKQNFIYYLLKRFYFRSRSAIIPHKWYAVVSYWRCYKKYLNVDNPKSYDERLWWLKFNYHNPLQTQCADKWAVRDYVKKCGLENILIENFGHFNCVDEIDVSRIPANEFFLKCNHLSGANMICQKESFDKNKIRKYFDNWLKDNAYYYGYEWPYKDMKPCLVLERVLHTTDPNGLLDYKIMCFDGEPKLLFLDIGVANADGTHAEEYYRNIYDMDFNPMDIKETREHYDYDKIMKPENFDYMIECARILSKPFPHCRVDLYNVDGKVYFGEITFYHGSGYNDIQPKDADLMMGSWIPLVKYKH